MAKLVARHARHRIMYDYASDQISTALEESCSIILGLVDGTCDISTAAAAIDGSLSLGLQSSAFGAKLLARIGRPAIGLWLGLSKTKRMVRTSHTGSHIPQISAVAKI
jgi:hypothetical protein